MLQVVQLMESIRLAIEHAPVPAILVVVPAFIILLAVFAGAITHFINQQTPGQSH